MAIFHKGLGEKIFFCQFPVDLTLDIKKSVPIRKGKSVLPATCAAVVPLPLDLSYTLSFTMKGKGDQLKLGVQIIF